MPPVTCGFPWVQDPVAWRWRTFYGEPAAGAAASRCGARPSVRAVVRGRHGLLRRVHGAAGRDHRDGCVPRAAAPVRHGLAAVQWVSLAYLLALTALLVPAGRWSDRVGRKLMYLYGFVVFTAASAACGARALARRADRAARGPGRRARRCCRRTAWRSWSPACPARTRRAALGVQAAAQAVGLASGPRHRRHAGGGGGLALGVLPQRPRCGGASRSWMGWFLLPRTRQPRRAVTATGPAGGAAACGRRSRHRPGGTCCSRSRRPDAGHLRAVRARLTAWVAAVGGGGGGGIVPAPAGAAGRRAAA